MQAYSSSLLVFREQGHAASDPSPPARPQLSQWSLRLATKSPTHRSLGDILDQIRIDVRL